MYIYECAFHYSLFVFGMKNFVLEADSPHMARIAGLDSGVFSFCHRSVVTCAKLYIQRSGHTNAHGGAISWKHIATYSGSVFAFDILVQKDIAQLSQCAARLVDGQPAIPWPGRCQLVELSWVMKIKYYIYTFVPQHLTAQS